MILFELLVGNNWHTLMDGFTVATGNLSIRVYFIVFMLIAEVRMYVFVGRCIHGMVWDDRAGGGEQYVDI